MRTAIFVYQPVTLHIETHETGLELCGIDTSRVPLSCGSNTPSIARGIYKVVSDLDVKVSGDAAAFEIVVTTQNKENEPVPPNIKATTLVEPIDPLALQAFFSVPEAKVVANP